MANAISPQGGGLPPQPNPVIPPGMPGFVPAGPAKTTGSIAARTNPGAPAAPIGTPQGDGSFGPGWQNKPYASMTPSEQAVWNQMQASINSANSGAAAASSTAATAAADLAERAREFNITTQRDIAKQADTKATQDALEVDALQKLLLGQTGPKDPYMYLFNSRGITTPQGYKPAGVPLTASQSAAWLTANPGKTPQDLQNTLTGGGVAPAWTQSGGTLGNMPQDLATSNPSVNPQTMQAQAPPSVPAPPAGQATQGVQNYMATPALQANVAAGRGIAPVPSMAGGGQVPGPPGTPSLAVVHGGEEVTPAPGGPPQMPGAQAPQPAPQGQDMQNAPGLHPAIAALIDAMSGLLQNPDFAPFVKGTLQSNRATPGGAPSMAAGGTVPGGGLNDTSIMGLYTGPGATQPFGPGPQPGQDSGTAAAAMNATAPPAPGFPYGPGPQPGQDPAAAFAAMNVGSPGSQGLPGITPVGALGTSPSAPAPTPTPSPTPAPQVATTANSPAGTVATNMSGMPQAPSTTGTPLGGAQGVQYNVNRAVDTPIMPISQMDPYSAALYDIMGKLHPYSAQQEAQMGPAATTGVQNYVGSVEGMPITDYTALADRLKPKAGSPSASTGTATEGFTFG